MGNKSPVTKVPGTYGHGIHCYQDILSGLRQPGAQRELSGWGPVLPQGAFWEGITKYPFITSHWGIPEMSYLGPFLDWLLWREMRQFNNNNKIVLIIASTYWPIWFLQTTLLGVRLKLWVRSSIWRAEPCSQLLGHLKVARQHQALLWFSRGNVGAGGGTMWISLFITLQALFTLCWVIFSSYDRRQLPWGVLRLL